MNEQLWWHMARASGLVAWALCTASVVWGRLRSTTLRGRRPAPSWLLDLHRFLGGLATVFVGVHVVALVADSYVSFGPAELLIPMASAWKPGPVAWGVVALYLLVAVEVTSLARKRLPVKLWRATHMASFPLWAFATVHTLTAGTDAGHPAVVLLSIASLGGVLFATVVRFLSPRSAARAAARTAPPSAEPTAAAADPAPAAATNARLERLAQRSAAARSARTP